MANTPQQNDPHRLNDINDSSGEQTRFDRELQADPELREGPASGGRIFIYGVAAAVLLGVVFYGLNSGSMNPNDAAKTASQSTPATQDSAPKAPAPTNNIADSNSSTKPPVAPGVRDVTPTKDNPGVTTGSAPARPQAPQSAPTGTEVDSSKGGAAN
ncbi:hypothetical protein RPMA_17375 [Tardiphaga alba]|uniref:Type IV secretion system protein VirB10 n=1 Tax=Tardiphaga alba TaxID=340268 RepID=A0ABX8ADE0_9BRAD|nr:hypothetical protein [Tardiphaga alba]QUS40405.1 hypothetical protein RPMA_17375 [Tardiphaga alba]